MADESVSDVSRNRIGTLYPQIQALAYRVLEDVYNMTKRKINVTEGLRSFDQQLACYQLGRELQCGRWVVTNPGRIVTNAKPGLSWHCYGLAFDCAWAGQDPYLTNEIKINRDVLWNTYGKVGQSHGFRWGGDFHLINGVNDLPHLEMSFGLTIEQALELYEYGGLKAVWLFIDKIRGVH